MPCERFDARSKSVFGRQIPARPKQDRRVPMGVIDQLLDQLLWRLKPASPKGWRPVAFVYSSDGSPKQRIFPKWSDTLRHPRRHGVCPPFPGMEATPRRDGRKR